MNRTVQLLFCVAGLYGLFLTWSLLQERINTKPYDTVLGKPVFFKAPIIINVVQALFASGVGFLYSIIVYGQNPFAILGCPEEEESAGGSRYWKLFLFISLTSSLSAPLGYQLLKHVDYVAYLLAKSSKLLPVMFVHFVLYRTRFPPHKYLVAMMVTGGVFLFTMSHLSLKNSVNDDKTLLGMAQLAGSMLLDGFTNSSQDQLFKLKNRYCKLTGASLMCILNCFVFVLTAAFLVVFSYLDLTYTADFLKKYPSCLTDIAAFALLGAVGQIFVFTILEKFDSLILVTATVTRKMISMFLSVVLFGHKLSPVQWLGFVSVFAGIGYESFVKLAQKKPKTA